LLFDASVLAFIGAVVERSVVVLRLMRRMKQLPRRVFMGEKRTRLAAGRDLKEEKKKRETAGRQTATTLQTVKAVML
jgi:hypothetical protein